MITKDITFRSANTQLVGSLVTVESPRRAPVVLLISGSGPLDRDSNTSRMRIDVMAQVATHLAGVGMQSLRYDKRGVGDSDGDFHSTGFLDNVDDARAAVDAIRLRTELVGCPIFVVGHSEGAIIAADLAAADPTLAGVVLLAGTASTGEEVLRWQAGQVSKSLPRALTLLLGVLRQDVVKTQEKRLAQIRASTGDTIRIQLVKLNAKWMREFMDHDPTTSLRQISSPLLALTGSKDIQVDPGDVDKIVSLTPSDSVGHVVADITHLLRSEAGPPSVRTYKKQAKRPVDRRVLELVSEWIGEVAGHDVAADDQPQSVS